MSEARKLINVALLVQAGPKRRLDELDALDPMPPVATGGTPMADSVTPEVRDLRQAFDEVSDLPFDSISVNFKWKPYFERALVPA